MTLFLDYKSLASSIHSGESQIKVVFTEDQAQVYRRETVWQRLCIT